MKRRQFATTLLGASAASIALPPLAQAQSGPVEGRHYVRLSQPVPVSTPPGKFEVIQFFWYGCPHCAALEVPLEAWVRALPPEVVFQRVPVAFRPEPFVAHQKIFYALDALGMVEQMHKKVFYAIHHDQMRLSQPAEIQAFMAKNGIDGAKFLEAYNSFGVQSKITQANKLADGYKIDGVPAFGIQGRFYTSGPLAGDNEKAMLVTDFLVAKLRKGG